MSPLRDDDVTVGRRAIQHTSESDRQAGIKNDTGHTAVSCFDADSGKGVADSL